MFKNVVSQCDRATCVGVSFGCDWAVRRFGVETHFDLNWSYGTVASREVARQDGWTDG